MAKKSTKPRTIDGGPGKRARDLRLKGKLTQREVAGDRYSVSYISSIERGKVPATLGVLTWIAERLDVPLTELLGSASGSELTNRRSRQAAAETAFVRIQAEMLLSGGDIGRGRALLDDLRRRLGDVTTATMLWFSAYAAFRDGDFAATEALLEDYQHAADARDDARGLAAAHWLMGLVHAAKQQPGDAMGELRVAVDRVRQSASDPDFLTVALRSLSEVLLAEHEIEEARRALGQALASYEEFANPQTRAIQLARQAQAAADREDFVSAYSLLRWAWFCRREARIHQMAGDLYLRHALLSDDAVSADTRIRDLECALELGRRTGDEESHHLAAAYLIVELILSDRQEEAESLAAREFAGVQLSSGAAPRRRAAVALANGWLAVKRGDVDAAKRNAADALTELDQVTARTPDLIYDYQALSRLFESLNLHKQALKALQIAIALRERGR